MKGLSWPDRPGARGAEDGSAARGIGIAIWLAAALAVLFRYRGIFGLGPCNDDYLLLREAESFGFFRSYLGHFWRPFEGLVAYASLRSAYDLHKVVQLGVFALTGWGVALVARRLSFRPLQAGSAAALFLFSPIAVSALFQIDTVSQALAGCGALWLFGLLLRVREGVLGPSGRWRLLPFVATAAAGLACLMTKETVLGVYCVLPIAAWFAGTGRERSGRALLRLSAPLLLALAAYFAARVLLVGIPIGAQGAGRYEADPSPLNVLRNVAMVAFGAVYPGDTVRLMTGQAGAWDLVPLAVAAAVLAFAAAAVRRDARDSVLGALGVLVAASCLPHAIGRASELYAFQSLPFTALLLGFVLVRRAPGAVVVLFACVVGWISTGDKIERVRVTWQRSEELRKDLLDGTNADTCRSLRDPGRDGRRYYSVFVVRDVELYESLLGYYRRRDACTPLVRSYSWSKRDRERAGR